ncbi:hypothetical protein C8F01DRAFT_462896 [Mycena amicta]|nr:hypothetical protein C8F01DRAFT_462896 [Mycena amicta]
MRFVVGGSSPVPKSEPPGKVGATGTRQRRGEERSVAGCEVALRQDVVVGEKWTRLPSLSRNVPASFHIPTVATLLSFNSRTSQSSRRHKSTAPKAAGPSPARMRRSPPLGSLDPEISRELLRGRKLIMQQRCGKYAVTVKRDPDEDISISVQQALGSTTQGRHSLHILRIPHPHLGARSPFPSPSTANHDHTPCIYPKCDRNDHSPVDSRWPVPDMAGYAHLSGRVAGESYAEVLIIVIEATRYFN